MKTAVYPGSFDPITLGHVDIIGRTRAVFDEVIVLVADSASKNYLFSGKERKNLIENSIGQMPGVKVEIYDGLTVNYLREVSSQVIIRGIRAVADFEYELVMANMNKKLAPEIETMIVFASPNYHYVSSRAIKEIAVHEGDLSGIVPDVVTEALKKKLGERK